MDTYMLKYKKELKPVVKKRIVKSFEKMKQSVQETSVLIEQIQVIDHKNESKGIQVNSALEQPVYENLKKTEIFQ